jgi:hypothetical protein
MVNPAAAVSMPAVPDQSGGSAGTVARCANGDRSTIHVGASTLSAMTSHRKPPTAGSEPTDSTRRGVRPRASRAAPTHSAAIGNPLTPPARAALRGRSARVTAVPSHSDAAATRASTVAPPAAVAERPADQRSQRPSHRERRHRAEQRQPGWPPDRRVTPASPDQPYGGHCGQPQPEAGGGHQGRQPVPHHGNRGGAGRRHGADCQGQRGGDDPIDRERRPPSQRPDREARPRQPNDDQR